MAQGAVEATKNTRVAEDIAGKYLTFRLENEDYGIEILKVQEIIQMQQITAVPRVDEFVRGVINLRGKVIPVIELRKNFGFTPCDDTDETCIVVVQIDTPDFSSIMGVIIDEVKEVLQIDAGMIEGPPALGSGVDISFIMGIGKVGGSVKILLDIDKVLAPDSRNGKTVDACSPSQNH